MERPRLTPLAVVVVGIQAELVALAVLLSVATEVILAGVLMLPWLIVVAVVAAVQVVMVVVATVVTVL